LISQLLLSIILLLHILSDFPGQTPPFQNITAIYTYSQKKTTQNIEKLYFLKPILTTSADYYL